MSDEVLYRKRKFISPDPDSGAYVKVLVERCGNEITGTFAIADCSRIINIEVNGWNKKRLRQTVRKFQKLEAEVSHVTALLEEELENM